MNTLLLSVTHYLVAALFGIGLLGFLVRTNALIVLMCIELMLNSVNLYLVALATQMGSEAGVILVIFAITVAAAEVAVGLGIVLNLYRAKGTIEIDLFRNLRG